jgi:hypothetical protein
MAMKISTIMPNDTMGYNFSIFEDPSVQKSPQFLVDKDSWITQFVGTDKVAFGNGIIDTNFGIAAQSTRHQSKPADHLH